MQMPKFYLRDRDQMMVEWKCPSCGGPVNQPVADDNYETFFKMYNRFHPIEKLCPACVLELTRIEDHKLLSRNHKIFA